MAPGIVSLLDAESKRMEAALTAVQNLRIVARAAGATDIAIALACQPLAEVMVPQQEQGPGHTEPMERDDVSAIRDHDPEDHPYGHKTMKLRTIGHD